MINCRRAGDVERAVEAGQTGETVRELGLAYPADAYSLSQFALTFLLSDSLYGLKPEPGEFFGVHLGAIAALGERGILPFSMDSVLRMSSNPFFPYLIERIEEGIAAPRKPLHRRAGAKDGHVAGPRVLAPSRAGPPSTLPPQPTTPTQPRRMPSPLAQPEPRRQRWLHAGTVPARNPHRRGRRTPWLLALVLLCAVASPHAAWAAQAQLVLMLYSNGRLLPANVEADAAIRERFARSADPGVELASEFLDSPRFGGEAYERAVADYLRAKYGSAPPRVLIAGSVEALEFWLRHRDEVFPGVPLVHAGVPQSRLASLPPLPSDVVGIPIELDIAGTIEQALRWHPEARRLVLVCDESDWGRSWELRVRTQAAGFADRLTVEVLRVLPPDELERRLRALPRDAIVFTPGYFVDGAGRPTTPRESARQVAAASAVPVYGHYSPMIGTGIVGGRLTGYDAAAQRAAEIVLELLAGAAPAALTLPPVMPSALHVDWRQLRRWGIDPRTLPPDAVVKFREPTFWESYGHWVAIALAVMLLQAGLIAALLIERARRRRAGAALARNEQHMSLAARAARLTMWTLDEPAQGAHKLPAPARDDASSPVLADFAAIRERIHPADRDAVDRAIAEARRTGGELDVQYRVDAADGTPAWQVARGRVDPAAGQRLLGIAVDITERKQAELEIAQSQAALQHMTRVSLLGQLSAAIAHQLNQPLASILANAEAAQQMLEREPLDFGELREIFDDIVAADRRAADVIRRLGALFRRGEPALAPLDLNEVVHETLEIMRTSLLTRQVAVETALAPELPPLDGDRVQLQQMLLNLIVNAADAMASLPEAKRRLTIETAPEAGGVRLCVRDRGPGVPPEAIAKVFDPFWTTKTGGMGIGLGVCRSIVAAHGGTLDVTNAPDGGAAFCARLPARAAR